MLWGGPHRRVEVGVQMLRPAAGGPAASQARRRRCRCLPAAAALGLPLTPAAPSGLRLALPPQRPDPPCLRLPLPLELRPAPQRAPQTITGTACQTCDRVRKMMMQTLPDPPVISLVAQAHAAQRATKEMMMRPLPDPLACSSL